MQIRLLLLAVAGLALPALVAAAEDPPVDTRNLEERSHLAHANAQIANGGGPAAMSATSTSVIQSSGNTSYGASSVVTPTTTSPEAEEHIACDPANAASLVAAISDFGSPRIGLAGYNTTKYAYSSNGGASWTESYVPYVAATGKLVTADGVSWDVNSDPVVAISRNGYVYLTNLYFQKDTAPNGIYVSVAAANGFAGFSAAQTLPVSVQYSASTTIDEDKQWIAVDNSGGARDGTVYISWTRFTSTSDFILVTSSSNQGAIWSTPIQVSLTNQNGAVQGSQIAVGPDGTVYVVYHVAYVGGKGRQFLTRSVDGGQTFTPASAITPLYYEPKFNSSYRKSSFAALAVTSSGVVCVAYPDQPSNTLGTELELVTVSSSGAVSAPATLNRVATGQQFMPAIAADSGGGVHVSWFDTRRSPSGARYYDIIARSSLDNGATWGSEVRLNAGLIDAGSASFIGDYAGICASGSFGGTRTAHPVWTNGGFNNGKLQTATLTTP